MNNAVKKIHYINENEDFNIMAAYQMRIAENQKLLDEIHRLNGKLNDLSFELIKAQDDANNYRDMYHALRQGNYLLIPK
ncbi:hypothetical protein D7Z26_01420 [Cohnella endophytica]|uniref:Uncharacterized protein n=1 Tax=Cohnella endophytica TaxID=2419778 RepID=A0A494YD34_9BACL|nr:hypothetical protein [Cohnella endophytica]RKP58191.1 hypothetical protein D7Z26_01420 [Cohnella endophytica]